MKTKKDFTFNLIQKDTQAMIRKYRRPLILISVLTGFLLFFLNVFLAIAVSGNKFNTEMKSKLGVYIYLRDSFSDQQSEVLKIKSELENSGLKVQFSSKEQALKFVEKRVPDLLTTLKKYDIKNPLPATLYVMYSNKGEFDAMKTILMQHENHILNMDELSDNAVKVQENRILNVINMSNFIQIFSYGVVLVMLVAILTFSVFFLKSIFTRFSLDIQAKKLLGASSYQIIRPFLNISFITLGVGLALMLILLLATLIPLDGLVMALFSSSLFTIFGGYLIDILAVFVIELIIVASLMSGVAIYFVKRMHKKLR